MVLNRAFGLDQDLDADQLEQEILDHFNKANEEAQWRASAVGSQLKSLRKGALFAASNLIWAQSIFPQLFKKWKLFRRPPHSINESTLIPEAWIRESNILKYLIESIL